MEESCVRFDGGTSKLIRTSVAFATTKPWKSDHARGWKKRPKFKIFAPQSRTPLEARSWIADLDPFFAIVSHRGLPRSVAAKENSIINLISRSRSENSILSSLFQYTVCQIDRDEW